MPTLSITKTYQDGDVLTEADLDAIRTSIQIFFNSTGINDTNIQNAGITRATKLKVGTANYVLINAADGTMSEEASLAISRGGLGFNATPGAGDGSKVLAAKSDLSGYELVITPESAISRIVAFNRYS